MQERDKGNTSKSSFRGGSLCCKSVRSVGDEYEKDRTREGLCPPSSQVQCRTIGGRFYVKDVHNSFVECEDEGVIRQGSPVEGTPGWPKIMTYENALRANAWDLTAEQATGSTFQRRSCRTSNI
jgi:hypothetical protein